MKIFFIICSAFYFNPIFSQIELLNNSLINPEAKIAYRGFDNRIVISGINVDSNTIIISSTDTLLRFNQEFIYFPKIKKEKDILTVVSNGIQLHQSIYSLERLQDPKIHFGIVRDTIVSRKYLLCNPGLILTYEPQIAKFNAYVASFEASIIKNNGNEIDLYDITKDKLPYWSDEKIDRYVLKNDRMFYGGEKFTKKQLKKLKRMKIGDIIWFKTVILNCPDCVGRKITLNLKLTLIE
ncbi:MAG: hypothetical protein RL632_2316 [Bacteroidota bacterium]|jgi:hypothetical protein